MRSPYTTALRRASRPNQQIDDERNPLHTRNLGDGQGDPLSAGVRRNAEHRPPCLTAAGIVTPELDTHPVVRLVENDGGVLGRHQTKELHRESDAIELLFGLGELLVAALEVEPFEPVLV